MMFETFLNVLPEDSLICIKKQVTIFQFLWVGLIAIGEIMQSYVMSLKES